MGDDREIMQMTGRILRRNKYSVSIAVGQAEARAKCEQRRFDLVIWDCDLCIPDMEAIIRGAKRRADPPLLLLISENREDEVPLLRAGADDWIQKPYQMEVLLARMAALLRQQENHRKRQ